MFWLLILIIIICIAVIFKLHMDKSELRKSSAELLENMFYRQKWLYLTMNEVKLLPVDLMDKVETLIMRMDYKPETFWQEMPTAKVLIIMDDIKKQPIGFLKTLKTNSCEPLFKRVMLKKSYVNNLENSIYISSVFIHPDYRGKGYGQKLLNLCLKLIKIENERYEKIILEVKRDNHPAIKLYEKLGFKTIGKDKVAFLQMLEYI